MAPVTCGQPEPADLGIGLLAFWAVAHVCASRMRSELNRLPRLVSWTRPAIGLSECQSNSAANDRRRRSRLDRMSSTPGETAAPVWLPPTVCWSWMIVSPSDCLRIHGWLAFDVAVELVADAAMKLGRLRRCVHRPSHDWSSCFIL